MYPSWLLATFALLPLALCRHVDMERSRRTTMVEQVKPQRRSRNGSGSMTLKPYLSLGTTPPEDLEVAASKSKVLECEAGGIPPPTIHWLKDGHRVPQSVYEAVNSISDGNEDVAPVLGVGLTRSRLYVDCAGPHDEGVYTCVAENPFSRVSHSTSLSVVDWSDGDSSSICLAKKSFGAPARIHMWTHSRLEMMGSDVQLFCRSDGEPQPQVTWLGPDDIPITDMDKYQVLENGDLVIRDIGWSDMGGYTCVVDNPNGSDSTVTFLYPTRPEKRRPKA